MISAHLATTLLGRTVRLHHPPEGSKQSDGEIVAVYGDPDGLHFLILLGGRLLKVESSAFTVLRVRDD